MTYQPYSARPCEVEYAYDGNWFYLRIDGNVMTGKIEGTEVVFDTPQSTSPGLDVQSVDDLYGFRKNQKYLCLINSKGESFMPEDGELRFKYKVIKTEDGDPSDPTLVSTFFLELTCDNDENTQLCFRNRNVYNNRFDPEKNFKLPLVINDVKDFPTKLEDDPAPVFYDPYDPYIAGTWRRDEASGTTMSWTDMIFSHDGEYKEHYHEVYFGSDPDGPDGEHEDRNRDEITEKGTWKTDRGHLIREYRRAYSDGSVGNTVYRDTVRYRSKLLGRYIPMTGTYLEAFRKWSDD